ncbi:hypothetical protein AeMF1_005690 [Aphanomyces euteiches]|nr:hypothetical protein AeMF1_005690 [Aphanomyces euteiches]KAH9184981.1 hypothetical protein AeNC1_013044 [Aphanomyces euteiches]
MSELKETAQSETKYGSFAEGNPTFVGDDDDDVDDGDDGGVEDFKKSLIQLFQESKFSVITSRLQAGILTEDDYSSAYGYSIMSYAALLGKEDILQLILKRVNYKKIYDYAYDPIYQAAKKNRRGIVRILLDNIKDIDLTSTLNTEEWTVLHVAAANGFNEILEMLIEAGAPVDIVDGSGLTPLHYAAWEGHRRAAEILLENGANIDKQVGIEGQDLEEYDGWTPIHFALASDIDDVEYMRVMVNFLLRANASLDIQSKDDQSVTDVAHHQELAELVSAEDAFRTDYPIHRLARDGKLAEIEAWIAEKKGVDGDEGEGGTSSQLEWKGQYQQGGEWHDTSFKTKVLRVNGVYRFIGQDKDSAGGFSIKGTWSDNHIELEKEYEDGYCVSYEGDFDESTSQWKGYWSVSGLRDEFHFDVPVFDCPSCGRKVSGVEGEECLECGGPDAGIDVTEEELDEMRAELVDGKAAVSNALNEKDSKGLTVFMHAIMQCHLAVLKALLPFLSENDLAERDEEGRTALDIALGVQLVCAKNTERRSNNDLIEMIELLSAESKVKVEPWTIPQNEHMDVPSGDGDDNTCCGDCQLTDKKKGIELAKMAEGKQWEDLKLLLAQQLSANILNHADESGSMALHRVCEHGNAEVLELLLKQRHIDRYPQNSDGEYPLLVAKNNQRVKCVRVLLKDGAPPMKLRDEKTDEENNFNPVTLINTKFKADRLILERFHLQEKYPLFYEAKLENIQQAESCVDAKQTPLFAAVLGKQAINVVRLLVECNIDVDLQDIHGRTALMIAAKNGDVEIVNLLLQQEPLVDLIDENGESALFYAAKAGHVDVVESLLKALADLDLKNKDGRTPLDCVNVENKAAHAREDSVVTGHEKIRDMLLKEGETRESSLDYRKKLAKSLVGMEAQVAFEQNGFNKAVNCSPKLARSFLDDCVDMKRHDVGFDLKSLVSVYGKKGKDSVLYAMLNLKDSSGDEMQTEAKEECLDHVLMHRVLSIKWELFAQRKYSEQLFMNILLLVMMTVSSIIHGDELAKKTPTVFDLTTIIGTFTFVFAIVGFATVQLLYPRTLWRLARFMHEGSLKFDPYYFIPHLKLHKQRAKRRLAFIALVLTVVLTAIALFLTWLFKLESSYRFFVSIVLGVTAVYFLWQEAKEMWTDEEYFESMFNIGQLFIYVTIFFVIVPVNVGIYSAPEEIRSGIGAFVTITLWILSVQYLEVVPSASFMLPMMANMMNDVKNFFIFFGVFQIGLTVSFYQLFRKSGDGAFISLPQSFITTYFVAFGNLPTDSLDSLVPEGEKMNSYQEFLYTVAVVMMMFQAAVVVIMLLNVLMAMMNNAVDGGLESAKTEALAKYAECILRLELALNLSEKQVKDSIYFVLPGEDPTEPMGKLNPLFYERCFKSELNMNEEQENKIQQHMDRKQAWADLMEKLETQTNAQLKKFEDKLNHVKHFTLMDVDHVFANEFAQIKDTRSQVSTIFERSRKAKGQDRDHVLDRLQNSLNKQFNKLEQDILRVWIANKDEAHKKCVLLFHLAFQRDMETETNTLKNTIKSELEESLKQAAKTMVDEPKLSELKRSVDDSQLAMTDKIQESSHQVTALVQEVKADVESNKYEMEQLQTKLDELMEMIRELKGGKEEEEEEEEQEE